MSDEAIDWAHERKGLSVDERRVLMALALQADVNDDTPTITMPWIVAMAAICQMTTDRLLMVLRELICDGAMDHGSPMSFRLHVGKGV